MKSRRIIYDTGGRHRIQSNDAEEGCLYRESVDLRPNYENSLAFNGCYDLRSFVNSTWMIVRLHKEYSELYGGEVIRQKQEKHLTDTRGAAGQGLILDYVDCLRGDGPSGSTFLSPSFARTALMSRILRPDSFAEWVSTFLPSVNTTQFSWLMEPIEEGGGYLDSPIEDNSKKDDDEQDEGDVKGAKSLLIELALHRADALQHIADAFPR